jgi:hypothetical protein
VNSAASLEAFEAAARDGASPPICVGADHPDRAPRDRGGGQNGASPSPEPEECALLVREGIGCELIAELLDRFGHTAFLA